MLISEHLYSCRFGTFLYNSPLERQNASVITNSVSLWTYVLNYPEISKLANPLFDPIRNSKSVLYPSFSAKTIVVWPDFWYRYLPHEMIGLFIIIICLNFRWKLWSSKFRIRVDVLYRK